MAKPKYAKWMEPENLVLLEGWARDGLSEEQIAHNMGISRSTLNVWKEKYEAISDTIKKGKEVADYEIENAMFKAAKGYYVEEWEEKLTDIGEKVKCSKCRWVAPNSAALIFWLKNRRPDKWKEKPVEINQDSNEKLDELIAAIRGV